MTVHRILSRSETRAVYDRIGRRQDTQAFYEDPALDALIEHGDFGNARSIFEVGCGTGRLAERLLRDHYPSEPRYVGVDLSPRMVEIARERLAAVGDRAHVRRTDGAFAFDAADDSQDRVVATYLLDLLAPDDIQSFLDEAHRLLRPEGRLCLAGLTWGDGVVDRCVSRLWAAAHAIRPEWVGGCRPLCMCRYLGGQRWTTRHHQVVRGWGVPSEVLIASPA